MTKQLNIINVYRTIQEDGLIKPFFRCMRKTKIHGTFTMETTNGCNTAPFRINQYIQLKPTSHPIHINEGSKISYNAGSNSWDIILPRWYFSGDYDKRIKQTILDYGFDGIIEGD